MKEKVKDKIYDKFLLESFLYLKKINKVPKKQASAVIIILLITEYE